ncbi:MAG: hypothetical protein EA397_04385 [Deltaproteobacteria bacterium]|nr:MAG: hypothetical protein EA397_04385 [Deltaproteobacteria bacterium]
MRALAWFLLLVGVLLGAAGAALNAEEHQQYRAELGLAITLERAEQARLRAADRLAEAPPEEAASARDALAAADVAIEALREAGTFEGDLAQAAASARAAVSRVPTPIERLIGWLRVGGIPWGLGVVAIGAGAWLARREQARTTSSAATSERGAVDFLAAVDSAIEVLNETGEAIADLPLDAPTFTVRTRIDALQDEVLTPLVEGRGQLIARHGLTTFAVYFGAFSAGERNLARVWSALTDGHTPTARDALQASLQSFEHARAAYVQAETASATAAPAPD